MPCEGAFCLRIDFLRFPTSDFGGRRKYPYGGNFVWMFSARHTAGIFAIIRPFRTGELVVTIYMI